MCVQHQSDMRIRYQSINVKRFIVSFNAHTHALAKSKIRFSQLNLPADATPGTVWAVAKLRAVSNQTQAELSFRGYHLAQQGHETEREVTHI